MHLPVITKTRVRYGLKRGPLPEEKTVCTQFSQCRDCPYPGHGFICWNKEGACMREIMQKQKKGADKNDPSGTGQP